jgi:predicted site-specific integrase-resolvase
MTIDEFTVRDFARKEQVNEKTVRRWIVKGAVEVRRTPGGGIRIVERRDDRPRAVFFGTSGDNRGHLST